MARKFYETIEFLTLNLKWKTKLAKSGFKDIEDLREDLKQPDGRTQVFQTQVQAFEFFQMLDEYLRLNQIPRRHRKCLEMYSQGTYQRDISVELQVSERYVRKLIAHYTMLILRAF